MKGILTYCFSRIRGPRNGDLPVKDLVDEKDEDDDDGGSDNDDDEGDVDIVYRSPSLISRMVYFMLV